VDSGGRGQGEEEVEWEEQVITIEIGVKDTLVYYERLRAGEVQIPFTVLGIPTRDTPFMNSI
jgi:hypothetical protein